MEHNPVIGLFLILGIILAAARGGGAIARRLNQPRVLGELLVGIVLGPTLFDLMHTSLFGIDQAQLEDTILQLAELGVLLLMFKVGLEVHLNELFRVGVVALIAGVIGALVPIILTIPLTSAFGYDWKIGLFAGVALAATSVSISAQVLVELDLLRTKVGNALLAAALVDDVVAILLISLAIAITGPTGNVEPGVLFGIIVRMLVYLGAAFAVAWYVLPRLASLIHAHREDADAYGIPAFALVMAFLFGWSAEYFGGVAAITGAFIAGVGLSRTAPVIKRQIEVVVSNVAYSLLVPIFFVSVGLQTNLRGFPVSALPFAGLLLAAALISKIVGCGLGARIGGFNNLESLRLGTCMIARGEVGLIICALGIRIGIFDPDSALFVSLFSVILLTTVLAPPFVRLVFDIREHRSQEVADYA